MTDKRKLHATITPQVVFAATPHLADMSFAARIPELGLTAYGGGPLSAVARLHAMYASAVRVHASAGTLEEWLTKAGIAWEWETPPEPGPVEVVVWHRIVPATPESWAVVVP